MIQELETGEGAFKFKANPEIAISCFGVSPKENVKNAELTESKVKRGSGPSEPGEEFGVWRCRNSPGSTTRESEDLQTRGANTHRCNTSNRWAGLSSPAHLHRRELQNSKLTGLLWFTGEGGGRGPRTKPGALNLLNP